MPHRGQVRCVPPVSLERVSGRWLSLSPSGTWRIVLAPSGADAGRMELVLGPGNARLTVSSMHIEERYRGTGVGTAAVLAVCERWPLVEEVRAVSAPSAAGFWASLPGASFRGYRVRIDAAELRSGTGRAWPP